MSELVLRVTEEQAKDMPMVDLAFEILKAANKPYYYRDLMQEIAVRKSLGQEDVLQVIAQVYTEMNIDGRFACVGNNLWGLKRWYPVEKSEDSVSGGATKRPRILNEEDDLDEEELFLEEQEDEFEAIVGDKEGYDVLEETDGAFFDEPDVEADEIEGDPEFSRVEDDEDEESLEDGFEEAETEVDPLDEVVFDDEDEEDDDMLEDDEERPAR